MRPFIEYLRKGGGIEELEVAGSYRRRMETVGDIDILGASDSPEAVMQRFQTYPEVTRVVAAGTTRGTVVLGSGLQRTARCRVGCLALTLVFLSGVYFPSSGLQAAPSHRSVAFGLEGLPLGAFSY